MMDTIPFEVGNSDEAYTSTTRKSRRESGDIPFFRPRKSSGRFRRGYNLPGVVAAAGCRGCGPEGAAGAARWQGFAEASAAGAAVGAVGAVVAAVLGRVWLRQLLPVLGRLLLLLNAVVWPESPAHLELDDRAMVRGRRVMRPSP